MTPEARMAAEGNPLDTMIHPLSKTAMQPTCLVDFNSPEGMSYMADKAYAFYAVSPFYYQFCPSSTAWVHPISGYTNYYLVPEQANVCPGNKGMIGTGPDFAHCTNQKSAALFPRYAASATSSDPELGIQVTLLNGFPYRLNGFLGKSGTIKVVAYRVGIGWWYWGPLVSNNTNWYFPNAEKVTDATFYAWDPKANTFAIDNVSLNSY